MDKLYEFLAGMTGEVHVKESKWIKFEKADAPGRKTDVYEVKSIDGKMVLGRIKWHTPWRKYSFFPSPDTVFETDCLHDIIKFIDGLMLDRKAKKLGESNNEKLREVYGDYIEAELRRGFRGTFEEYLHAVRYDGKSNARLWDRLALECGFVNGEQAMLEAIKIQG